MGSGECFLKEDGRWEINKRVRIRLDEEQNKIEKQREAVAREKQASDASFLEEDAMEH